MSESVSGTLRNYHSSPALLGAKELPASHAVPFASNTVGHIHMTVDSLTLQAATWILQWHIIICFPMACRQLLSDNTSAS